MAVSFLQSLEKLPAQFHLKNIFQDIRFLSLKPSGSQPFGLPAPQAVP